jgi:putative hydrolase of the HAD superfamily
MVARAVLFDFGGTLNTDGDHWGVLFRDRLSELSDDVTDEELKQAYVQSERRLVAEGLDRETFHETLQRQLHYQYEALPRALSVPSEQIAAEFYRDVARRMGEVRHLFERYAPAAQLGVVSNFYGNLEAVLREFDLLPFLGVVVDSSILGIRKPDPRIWTTAIQKAGVTPEETVIVGDSYKNDIAPGREIGARTVWYRGKEWSGGDPDREAHYDVSSLDQLDSLLESLLNETA